MKMSTRLLSEIIRFVISIIAVIMLAVFVVWSFFGRATVDNNSMNDLLKSDDKVLIDRFIYNFGSPKRFDVVYFSYGVNSSAKSIKRVIGLPGESVNIKNGEIYIDGNFLELPEGLGPYNVAGLAENPIKLGKEEYFVLGDNAAGSDDSRFSSVGNIKAGNIEGKVWFRVSPISDIGFVSSTE